MENQVLTGTPKNQTIPTCMECCHWEALEDNHYGECEKIPATVKADFWCGFHRMVFIDADVH